MFQIQAFAAQNATSPLAPFSIHRREPGPHDVLIEILFCGVCHSDLHQARDEWGGSLYPMVPGHEIVGQVTRVGEKVTRFRAGDKVGVGCFVDSCRDCHSCHAGLEQYCDQGMVATYNGLEKDRKTPTYGGYSTHIVVDEHYVLRIPESLPLDKAAPLLCAGITTYSPLRTWKAGPGKKVAVLGMGGLGHMAVKLAHKMGAEVTVLGHSLSKKEDARNFGADHFHSSADPQILKKLSNYFDLILNTVPVDLDWNQYLNLVKRDGAMVILGIPPKATAVEAANLIMKRRTLAGSLIGGIAETQEMLDFCGQHYIVSDVEVIPMNRINEAYERMLKGDVRYRFVIDMESLKKGE